MLPFNIYVTDRQSTLSATPTAFCHADVSLLAHLALIVCGKSYDHSVCLKSRDFCFSVAFDYVTEHVWPLTQDVPANVAKTSVLLGGVPFARGSLRRWVGDLHGLVMAQLTAAAVATRRRSSANSRAKKIRENARTRLGDVTAIVARLAAEDPLNIPLFDALKQFEQELFGVKK